MFHGLSWRWDWQHVAHLGLRVPPQSDREHFEFHVPMCLIANRTVLEFEALFAKSEVCLDCGW